MNDIILRSPFRFPFAEAGNSGALWIGVILVVFGILAVYLYRQHQAGKPLDPASLLRNLLGDSHDVEARLHKVVCYHCNRGNGILNPVYSRREDEMWVEGVCNCCRQYLRVRLNP